MILPTTKHTRNIHEVTCQSGQEFLLISDLHWDNPHCDRGLLKNHLDEAVKRNAAIILNGDTLCLMGGRYDKRADKSGVRPEHQVNNYLQAVTEDAANWFKPYAENILLIGYGNHETSIVKHTEFDPLLALTSILNYEAGTTVQLGGYGATRQPSGIKLRNTLLSWSRWGWPRHTRRNSGPTLTGKHRRLRPHLDGPCP
jgi:hypothetical protein